MPAHIKAALTAVSLSVPIMTAHWRSGSGGAFISGNTHHRGERQLIVNVLSAALTAFRVGRGSTVGDLPDRESSSGNYNIWRWVVVR
jgi:hypothetical protein